jgi:hypothetical protein
MSTPTNELDVLLRTITINISCDQLRITTPPPRPL